MKLALARTASLSVVGITLLVVSLVSADIIGTTGHLRSAYTYEPAARTSPSSVGAASPAPLSGASTFAISRPFLAPEAETGLTESFHYGSSKFAQSIAENGLRPGTFATPAGDLSPLQATVELSLPPNRASSDMLVRIDVAGLRGAGYEIPQVTRVGNVVPGDFGRVFSMPGGGWEMRFPYAIPPEFVGVSGL